MKKSILMLMCVACAGLVKAQDYYHGLGLQANIGLFSAKYALTDEVEKQPVFVPGIFYKATLAFEINRDVSFAISAYPFIGMSGSLNSQSGASEGTSIGVEFPLLGELYFGDLDDNCFFFGAGFSASAMASTYGSGKIVGPQFDIGGQFNIGNRFIGTRASFTYGLNNPENLSASIEKYNNNLITFGFYYLLGQ